MKVFAAAIDFGMGPVGKLASIVASSCNIEWVACGDPFVLDIFQPDSFCDHYWTRDPALLRRYAREHRIDSAVVVLDPELAIGLEQENVKVTYVDSLPFLWTEKDLVPSDVSCYCAQFTPYLPQACWPQLRRIKNLIWVESIIPDSDTDKTSTERCWDAVINFGGVHSTSSRRFSYLEAVLPPALRALESQGMKDVLITASPAAVRFINDSMDLKSSFARLRCRTATLQHAEFLGALRHARLLLTSPGLTTLLEASRVAVPTLLLPPQNLSQYRNGECFIRYSEPAQVILWRHEKLLSEFIDTILPRGETHVVDHICATITSLAEDKGHAEWLRYRIMEAVSEVLSGDFKSQLNEVFGGRGGRQVLSLLRRSHDQSDELNAQPIADFKEV